MKLNLCRCGADGLFAAAEAVDAAEKLIEAVFDAVEGEVPSARVVNLMAAEGLFVLGEAIPGVVRVVRGGDAPEIKGVGAVMFGVEDHLDEKGSAGGEFAMSVIGGGVGVETSAFIIVNEGGGDRLMV